MTSHSDRGDGDMSQLKSAIAGLLICSVVLCGPVYAQADCKEPQTGTENVPVLSPPLGEVVIGTGRLAFFLAPDRRCPMHGVFVVPGDRLIAYAQSTSGWSQVMYSNPKT